MHGSIREHQDLRVTAGNRSLMVHENVDASHELRQPPFGSYAFLLLLIFCANSVEEGTPVGKTPRLLAIPAHARHTLVSNRKHLAIQARRELAEGSRMDE